MFTRYRMVSAVIAALLLLAGPTSAQAPPPTPPASTAPSDVAATPPVRAPRSAAEAESLRVQITALASALEQMQKVDSKIANIAPWIAASIAIVTFFIALFPITLAGYEWFVRRTNERKFEEFKTDVRTEIERTAKLARGEITSAVEDKMVDRIDHLIMTELRKITKDVEGGYSKNLALVEHICYCALQNEFQRRLKDDGIGAALEYLHVFRYLLIHLIGGSSKERQTALHRLDNEFVDTLGPTTGLSLGTLLKSLDADWRFTSQDLAQPLQSLLKQCNDCGKPHAVPQTAQG